MNESNLHRDVPPGFDEQEPRQPARWELLKEGRIIFERMALAVSLRRIEASAQRGGGEAVMVVPGFASDDGWTARLRGFLNAIGYDAVGWGPGRNRGNVPKLIPQVVEQTDRLAQKRRGTVRLVRWSLGGYLAREAARERPELVERVITLGAPIVGGPT
jgi:pimeloyl-ACP methyl ester carboxylesterase